MANISNELRMLRTLYRGGYYALEIMIMLTLLIILGTAKAMVVLHTEQDTTIFRLMVLRILVIVMMETVDAIRSSFLASVYLAFLIYIKDIV